MVSILWSKTFPFPISERVNLSFSSVMGYVWFGILWCCSAIFSWVFVIQVSGGCRSLYVLSLVELPPSRVFGYMGTILFALVRSMLVEVTCVRFLIVYLEKQTGTSFALP